MPTQFLSIHFGDTTSYAILLLCLLFYTALTEVLPLGDARLFLITHRFI